MELFEKFGINWGSFLSQVVNFFIVLFVLYKFAYKPILKTLDERTRKIEKGLKDAEASNQLRESIEAKAQEESLKSQKQAERILAAAHEEAEDQRKKMLEDTRNQSGALLLKAKDDIQKEKVKMLQEAKEAMAELVVLSTEKILKEKLSEEKDHVLVKDTLEYFVHHQKL